MSRLIDADALEIELLKLLLDGDDKLKSVADVAPFISNAQTVDAVDVVRCKDCKHRPKVEEEHISGFDIEFPDYVCPCQCSDGFYNWMPNDDWFCADGERKEE